MKTLKTIGVLNAILFAAIGLTSFIWSGAGERKNSNEIFEGQGFAVLELFTSEGCNSCPPAEEVLDRVRKDYKDEPVYVLNYHVDYFDNLGWKDVFGSPENTRRQQKYSTWLNAQVYTPQLVVNGSAEMIGSEEKQVRSAVSGQLVTKNNTSLSLTLSREESALKVDYQTGNIHPGDYLVLALVQKNGSTNVLRGENAGLKFDHVQIVRKTVQVSLKETQPGSALINIPKEIQCQELEVIGMVQNSRTGKIAAANAVSVAH